MDRKYRIWAEIKRKASANASPVEPEVAPPFEIDGVADRYIKVLIDNGYDTIEDLMGASLQELIDLDGIGETMAEKILSGV